MTCRMPLVHGHGQSATSRTGACSDGCPRTQYLLYLSMCACVPCVSRISVHRIWTLATGDSVGARCPFPSGNRELHSAPDEPSPTSTATPHEIVRLHRAVQKPSRPSLFEQVARTARLIGACSAMRLCNHLRAQPSRGAARSLGAWASCRLLSRGVDGRGQRCCFCAQTSASSASTTSSNFPLPRSRVYERRHTQSIRPLPLPSDYRDTVIPPSPSSVHGPARHRLFARPRLLLQQPAATTPLAPPPHHDNIDSIPAACSGPGL